VRMSADHGRANAAGRRSHKEKRSTRCFVFGRFVVRLAVGAGGQAHPSFESAVECAGF
jgi:hypothetical protein